STCQTSNSGPTPTRATTRSNEKPSSRKRLPHPNVTPFKENIMANAHEATEEKQKTEGPPEQKPSDKAAARKKRGRKNIAEGVVHIHSTFNNTIVTITDYQGNVISWSSAGAMGFKGSRKGTPFAAQQAADSAAKKAMDHGLRTVQIFVRGPGAGRESALRALQSAGINI